MRAGLVPGAICLIAAAKAGLAAAEPRSAIPWLSQSLREAPAAEATAPENPDPEATDAAVGPASGPESGETIAVTPLDEVALDAVGILAPAETGFRRDLWGPTPAERVETLIREHADSGVPAARTLFRRILLAEADPPEGAGPPHGILIARIDRLLAAGALEEAEALVERAGVENPDLFRRMFDIGLLLDRAEPACEALRRNPTLSPTLPARIFCLARDGDWNAAEITLTLGRDVGQLSSREELALARFLDPELFEHLPPPPPPEPFTPLDFLLREAVGLPRPTGPLPLAFLHHDLADYLPMRGRITAGERLVLEGAIEPEILFAAYRAGEPAASGGLWDRAEAVQTLDRALAGEGDIGTALVAADEAMTRRGLRPAFAKVYRDALAEVDAVALDAGVRGRLVELLLLGGAYVAAAEAAGDDTDERTRLLLALAETGAPGRIRAEDAGPLAQAAFEGLRSDKPADERGVRLLDLLAEGRQGEAIIGALALLEGGTRVDPPGLAAALRVLREAGQEESARRIAIETLLADGRGEE